LLCRFAAFAARDAVAPPASIVYYVANNGNDTFSGTLSAPAGGDGPFATLARAVNAVGLLKSQQGGTLQQPVTIAIRAGTYFLSDTLLVVPFNSGSITGPVTFTGYLDERPVISGGRRLAGWRAATVNGRSVWAADIPAPLRSSWYFHELWVNGQRRTRARYPDAGLLQVANVPDATADWLRGQSRFEFAPGDVSRWNNLGDVNVVMFNQWVSAHLPIASVDEANHIVSFDRQTSIRMTQNSNTSGFTPSRYYVENALEFLDSPGEWYLDRTAGTVYYMPMPGEEMATADVIAPNLTRLVQLQGNSRAGSWVEYVTFQNLTFAHTDWSFPPGDALDGAMAINFVYGGALFAESVRHVHFDNLAVAHTGTNAIYFPTGGTDLSVTRSELYDLGAGGVLLGPTFVDPLNPPNESNEISDCHVHDGGIVLRQAAGLSMWQTSQSRIIHNWVHDFGSTGIVVAGRIDVPGSPGGVNLVELNHVHNIGVRSAGEGAMLNDLGAIYLPSAIPGARVHRNLVRDVASASYGGNGIYLDEGTSGALVDENVVYRLTDGGFNLNFGQDNVVRNNVFAFTGRDVQPALAGGTDGAIWRGSPIADAHPHLTFDTNIVYWRAGSLFGGGFSDALMAFDHNLYWRERGDTVSFIGAVAWDPWRAGGQDLHSVIADPLFASAADLSLRPESPAFALGWQSIDLSDVGPRRPPGTSRTPPAISVAPAVQTAADTPLTVPLVVGSASVGADAIAVAASASNQALVPAANLAVVGQGSNRSLQIRPAAGQSGTTTITLTATDGGLPTTVAVVLTVTASRLSLDRTELHFGTIRSGAAFTPTTTSQRVRIIRTAPASVQWSVQADAPWLHVTPASGTDFGVLNISVTPTADLPLFGDVAGSVTVTSTSPPLVQTVRVGLHIYRPGQSAGPAGFVDTPVSGTSGVAGSIPVTGWALDDVQVARVRILRDPVPPEPAGSPVFIGDATLLEGARPDVAAIYSTMPHNIRAGWGYLMLTNFLPAQGNGTFRIHAIADDVDGHSTLLGTTTIVCDNAHSTAPFGAIDTPQQGEEASGVILNFGWVLAPGTARADVPGGGLVTVFVDGQPVGVPAGWTGRNDLTMFFPAGFSSLTSTLALFGLDTTTLADGVHTIAWGVQATNGQGAGIGSRFFTVSNGAASAVRAAIRPRTSAIRAPATLLGRRGFDLNTPLRAFRPGRDGLIVVHGEELDRIELHVGGATAALRTPDGLRPLPPGATYDPTTGVFTWQAGVGFVGAYEFAFDGRVVRVVLHPRASNRVGPQVVIDAPMNAGSMPAHASFVITGWAVDPGAQAGTGIDALQAWAYPVANGTRSAPIFIGAAAYGSARPDVGQIYGDRFTSSGWQVRVPRLEPGTYDLAVFAHSVSSGEFGRPTIVRVRVRQGVSPPAAPRSD
jgi:Right handed beta helix region/Viral BACON domain